MSIKKRIQHHNAKYLWINTLGKMLHMLRRVRRDPKMEIKT